MAGAQVLLQIDDVGVLLQKKAVGAVVPGNGAVFGVDAAACHNGDIGAFANKEIVINQIVHPAVGHQSRDGDGFPLGPRANADHQAGAVGLIGKLDVFGGTAACRGPILPDVIGAGELPGPL